MTRREFVVVGGVHVALLVPLLVIHPTETMLAIAVTAVIASPVWLARLIAGMAAAMAEIEKAKREPSVFDRYICADLTRRRRR